MAVSDIVKPIADPSGMPIDPNVRVPESVTRAAQAAENIHKQAYNVTEPAPAPAPEPAPAPLPDVDNFNGPADKQSLQDSEWARRYNSMYGRYTALQRTMGGMEEQMRQMAVELTRTQELVQTAHAGTTLPKPTLGHDHSNLITDEDREQYGDSLIDLARRAAKDAMTPEMDALRQENARLTNQVRSTGKRELFATLDRQVPNWRAVNKSVQFNSWLRLPNVYTGAIRGSMLKAAVDGAEAPKVIALFQDFLAEAAATGQLAPAAPVEQQPNTGAPRIPAVNLESLAAPGKARPASGETQMPTDKPIYSRAQISQFYRDSNRGLYAGREAEYRAQEADFQAAMREGRIR